ncbi:hypothetical protein ACHAW6_010783 [Cyclotella cf. meneghiniana]
MKLLLLSLAINLSAQATASVPFQNRRAFGLTSPNHHAQSTTSWQDSAFSLRGGEVHESGSLDELESLIQSAALNDKLTVIDFTATWCGPCKMIAPIFKELSEEHGSSAQFIKVDVDDNPEAAQKYGVSAMPTFLFIKGGEVVDRLMGANSDRLRQVRLYRHADLCTVNNGALLKNVRHAQLCLLIGLTS